MAPTALTDYNELLLKLYRLSSELPVYAFQDAALCLIKPVLAFDASMWGTATATPGGIDVHTLHLHEKTPEMMAEYEPLKHLDSAAARMFGRRRATQGFNSETWFAGRHERELRDYLRRFEQENIFITAASDPQTNFIHWITLFRSDPDQHCTPDEESLLSQLAPHVMQALSLNRVMHLDTIGPAGPAQRGAAIADLRGVLYHADPLFHALMGAEWQDAPRQRLAGPLLDSFLLGNARFRGAALIADHHIDQGLLFIKARERCRADALSPREQTVARLVAQGDTHKQIARMLGRSPATIRNQIQSIYEKLEVGNVAGLIKELALAE